MQIRGVSLFSQWQPFRDGTYRCSGGHSAEGFASTIVKLETEDGITGWGETAPLGSFYDPAFAAGAQAGIKEIAPHLLGADARGVLAVNACMDNVLKGHGYAKSALDMACWDAMAKGAGVPLWLALGGRFGDRVALYRSIAQADPEAMATRASQYFSEGYRRLQVKVGLDVRTDIERIEAVHAAVPAETVLYADANGGWRMGQAREFLRASRHIDYVLEQPCASYEENRLIRSSCDRAMVLDESIDSLEALLRAHGDGTMDGITIKISRVGGLTKARLIRDTAVSLGLGVTVEDTGGAEICTAAIAHVMLSTPETSRQHTVDFHNWVTVSNGKADFDCRDGSFTAPAGAGLGVAVDEKALDAPIFAAAKSGTPG